MGNHLSGAALALLVMAIMVSLSFPYTLYNGALYCNTTCADCVSALNNDSYSTVYLNSTLSSPGATCIDNPANFSNKTFDCQGYSITGDKTSSTYGIYLNSRTNATIRNCTIEAFYQNARFYHTFNSTVTSLISFNSSTECAFLYNFTNGTFSNNTLHNCSNEGMDLWFSVNSTIANNTIYETVQQCIELRDSDYSTIEYNLLHGCNGGVDLHGGGGIDEYVTIRNNTIYNSSSGIQIWRGVNNIIVNNTVHGPYNQIEYYRYVPISLYVLNGPEYCDNTVQDNIGPGGLPIYYSNETVNWDGLTAAQILLCDADNSVVTNSIVNASGDPDYAPFEANFMFRYCDNLTVSSSIADMGSFEFYDTTNTTVLDNTAHGAFSSGFSAFSSNGTYFYNNTAYDNNYTGFLIRSNNSTLEGNTAYNNGYAGIMVHIFNDFSLWTVGPNSTGANLTSNTVYGNRLGGIFISDSQNATISGNNVYSNGYGFVDYPLYWYYAVAEDRYFGIYLGSTYNVSVSNNTIHSNNYYGIALNNSDDTNITRNNIYNNSCQVQVNASNTLIYDNILNSTNSTQEVARVASGGTNNRWNTTRTCASPNILGGYCIGGNYYSNYTGIDTTRDGIGETSYTGTGMTDSLPITDNVLVFMGDLDLNYDGYMDVVFSNYRTFVSFNINSTIYWGSASGFSASNNQTLPTSGAAGNSIADLNNDGYLDIVFSNFYDGSTYSTNSTIYWGSASGFSASNNQSLPTSGAEGNSVADLNNDGYLDIVFSNYRDGSTYSTNSTIYWGSASGFSASNNQSLPTEGVKGNSVADLNNDGYLDMVFSSFRNDSTRNSESIIYWGSTSGFSASSATGLQTSGAYGNSVADLNNDGYLDIVFSNYYNGSTFNLNSTIYWNSPDGFSSSNCTGLPTYGAAANSVADLNNDGYMDIVFSNSWNESTESLNSTIYWNSPDGFNSSNYTGLMTYSAAGNAIADLNDDGYADVVFSNFYDGSSLEINSTIYWNSPDGFNSSNYTGLPTVGVEGVSAAIGTEESANTAYGTTQTLVPDFHTVMNQQLNGFIDLDVFFYSSGDYNLTVEGETSSVDVRIDSNNRMSIIPDTNWNGTVNNFRFAASRGSHTVYSNNFSIYILPGDWVEEEAGSEPGCITDSDCGSCETCTGGECTPYGECFIDSDCTAQLGEGYICDYCYCTPPECTSDADCGEGKICSQYSCVVSYESGCTSDSDCPTGYSCENSECVRVSGEGQVPGGECSSDNDCPPAQHCDGGTCSDVYCPCGSIDNHVCTGYECCSNSDCPQGYKCESNECVREAPEPGEGEGGAGEELPGGGEVEIPGEGVAGAQEEGKGSILGFLDEVLFDTTYEQGGVEEGGEPVMVAHKSIKEAWIWLIILLLAAAVYVFWRRRE